MLPPMIFLTMPSVSHARLAGAILATETVTTFALQNEAVYYESSDKTPGDKTNRIEAETIIRSVFDLSFSQVANRLYELSR